MTDVLDALQQAVRDALRSLLADDPDLRAEVEHQPVPIQEVPDDKPGDFGTPVAFTLARALRRNPVEIARQIVAGLDLPDGVASADAVGPYINFHLDPGVYVAGVATTAPAPSAERRKVVVEHSSVNPNKEAHV